MALMIAWKQWGDNMGRNDFNGNPISYRNELISILNTFVERAQGDNVGDTEWLTGIVGYDGYLKSGNTFNDLTPYGFTLPPGDRPQSIGPTLNYVDYHAPSYFKQWYEFLKVHAPNTWNVNQHLRASHSSDWLMGNLYSKSALTIPHAGLVSYVSYTNFTFGDAGPIGEDPRHPWRNFLNEVWHGSPDSTWNPTTLQVVPGGNTFQRDMAIRYATYLKRNQQAPWNVCDLNHIFF